MTAALFGRPAVLFLPASNPRAIAKARDSGADLVILDLEDAVKAEDKDGARVAAVEAVAEAWPMPVAIRVNAGDPHRPNADIVAVAQSRADFIVLPKVDETGAIETAFAASGKPVLAMIETPYAVMHLPYIIAAPGLAGLIAGTNDLGNALRIGADSSRSNLMVALQSIVLAARVKGIAAFDGVFNSLDDEAGLAAECAQSRMLGFDGKTLIHPKQIAPCRAAFAPSPDELARARRLVEAATGGAERFEGAMIETMHVDAARRLIERATGD